MLSLFSFTVIHCTDFYSYLVQIVFLKKMYFSTIFKGWSNIHINFKEIYTSNLSTRLFFPETMSNWIDRKLNSNKMNRYVTVVSVSTYLWERQQCIKSIIWLFLICFMLTCEHLVDMWSILLLIPPWKHIFEFFAWLFSRTDNAWRSRCF